MNPLAAQALGSIVRWVLAFGAGWFVQSGIWSSDAAEAYITAGALAVVGLGWSIWQKYKNRLLFLTALQSPPTTEETVKAKVSAGTGASLMEDK